jgi:hypothetical protein
MDKPLVMRKVMEAGDRFRPDFRSWLDLNYHIWIDFEARAMVIAKRRPHYSARRIIEAMRHDSAIRESGDEYKINGNYAPDLSRLFMLTHPEYAGFFSTRLSDIRLAA